MKFKLTTESINHYGRTLYRIEALIDFGNVKKGEKGGFVEKENNLSQNGNAWVYGNARVFGDARVSGKLKIKAGLFFGFKEKKEDLKFFDIDENYQLIGKGDCEVEINNENDEKKKLLLAKADELIQKANELKEEAENL